MDVQLYRRGSIIIERKHFWGMGIPDLSGILALINYILKKMTNHYLWSMSKRRERRNFFSCEDVSTFSAITTYGSFNKSFRSAIFVKGRVFLFLIYFLQFGIFFKDCHAVIRFSGLSWLSYFTLVLLCRSIHQDKIKWSLFSSKASARESFKCTSSWHWDWLKLP